MVMVMMMVMMKRHSKVFHEIREPSPYPKPQVVSVGMLNGGQSDALRPQFPRL